MNEAIERRGRNFYPSYYSQIDSSFIFLAAGEHQCGMPHCAEMVKWNERASGSQIETIAHHVGLRHSKSCETECRAQRNSHNLCMEVSEWMM